MTPSRQKHNESTHIAVLHATPTANALVSTKSSSRQPAYPVRPGGHFKSSGFSISGELSNDAIRTENWLDLAEMYLQDCELRLFSPYTITLRRALARNLGWFLHHRGFAYCGSAELRQFFYYLAHGHEEPGGRFGNPNLKSAARPITIKD